GRPLSDAAKELGKVQAAGCRLLTWDEPEYPARLREIYDPPPILYIKGNARLLGRHIISLVGARRPSPYGNQMAERLGRDLADHGLVVASGLARGIDASAHKGAISSGTGETVAVLGCGIDVVYPKENKKIYEAIPERGGDYLRVPDGGFSGTAEFSDKESDHRGDGTWGGGGRGGAILWITDYGAAGNGVWTRGVWRAGERDATLELRAESAYSAGGEAGDGLGGRDRR